MNDDTIGALDLLLGVGKAFALQPKAPKFVEQVAVEALDNGSYITALVQVDALVTVNWVGRRAVRCSAQRPTSRSPPWQLAHGLRRCSRRP